MKAPRWQRALGWAAALMLLLPMAVLAAWLARQAMPAAERVRLSFSADGRVLSARSWATELSGGIPENPRDMIRISWAP